MAMDSPKGFVRYFEDFLGDTLDTFNLTVTTNSGTCAITAEEIDGTVQLTTHTDSGDSVMMSGAGNWRVQDGSLRLEARVQVTSISDIAFYVGFSDANTESNVLPLSLSVGTWTTTASTAIGFCYDTDATNDNIHCMWVDDDADASVALANLRFTGLAPKASKWYTYIVELTDAGTGNGAICEFTVIDDNGNSYSKRFTGTIDRDAVLFPVVAVATRTTSAKTLKADYWKVIKSRANN